MKKLLFGIILITGLSGCSRNIDCIDPPIYISFISFTPNTLDRIVIRKFDKGNNFQNLIDTFQVIGSVGSINNRGDTSDLILVNSEKYPKPGFDWQIFIPTINRTIYLTEINKKEKTIKCAVMQMPVNCLCNDEILNLKVDNQPGVFSSTLSYNLFIR